MQGKQFLQYKETKKNKKQKTKKRYANPIFDLKIGILRNLIWRMGAQR